VITPTPSLSILLVGLETPHQRELIGVLVAEHFRVFQVATTADAWAVLKPVSLSIVLLQVSRSTDALTFCRQLKATSTLETIPVLCFGPREHQDDCLQAFAAGAADYISIPYWAEEVLARIRVHLAAPLPEMVPSPPLPPSGRLPAWFHSPLLANLQRVLHQQALKRHEQNAQLQREVKERGSIEQALRQEQDKSERLLLNILPEAIVAKLKQVEGSLAQRYDEATVLFADIVDFTPLAAQQSPLELVSLLNQIFSAFDRLAEKYQVEKIKTIGDAYMAVGGVPVPQENHAVAIADMALEMLQVIQQFQRENNQPIALRIGINTGSVVAGVIGIRKFSFDLWGDTVNVASRMESQGIPNAIQVTTATYKQLQPLFIFEPAPKLIEVKGKGLMQTYFLRGRRLNQGRNRF
jgi:class 3 adenylate cyclase/CheY-like chemotaxis protein